MWTWTTPANTTLTNFANLAAAGFTQLCTTPQLRAAAQHDAKLDAHRRPADVPPGLSQLRRRPRGDGGQL